MCLTCKYALSAPVDPLPPPLRRCLSIFFVEFQLHFEKDYSTTAWIHSMVDCMTMLCGESHISAALHQTLRWQENIARGSGWVHFRNCYPIFP